MKIVVLLTALIALIVSLACGSSRPGSRTVDVTGTMHFTSIEGGAWLLRGDDGTVYNPSGLPESFEVEGLAVRAQLLLHPDHVSPAPGLIADVISIAPDCSLVGSPGGPAYRACLIEVPSGATVTYVDGGTVVSLDGGVIATYGPCPCTGRDGG